MEVKKRSRVLSVVLIMAVTFTMLFVDCDMVSAATDAGQNIAIDETNFPDREFKSYVSQFDTNGDNYLSEEECSRVRDISFYSSNSAIKSLSGIEFFTNLERLSCASLQITELDVSNNRKIKTLGCSKTGIASLDLSQNVLLEELDCSETFIETLDLSKNTNLKKLNCSATGITELDLKVNTALKTLICGDMRLLSLDLQANIQLEELNCNNSWISELNVEKNNNLLRLFCNGTKVKSLDLTQNTELRNLTCNKTSIETLDLSKNTWLEVLDCSNTKIKELDLSKNVWLKSLGCAGTQITKLDLSQNKGLRGLVTEGSPIAYLDLSNNAQIGTNGINLCGEITINTNENTLDLEKQFPGIDVSRILEIYADDTESDIKLEGNILSGYHDDTYVFYTYDCKAPSTKADNFHVCLRFNVDSNGSDSSAGSSGSSGGGWIPPASEQKPAISEGEGYSTFIGDNGKTALIVTDEGYDIKDVKVNGVSKGALKKVTSLKSGDKVEVFVIKKSEVIKEIKEQLMTVSKENFKTNSAQVKMKSGKKAIKITWKNTSGVEFDGVEVFRSMKKKSGYGKKPIYTSKTDKFYNTSIKKGTRYYYKVRGYIEYDGIKYYTDWSTKAYRAIK